MRRNCVYNNLNDASCLRIPRRHKAAENNRYDHEWFDSNETIGGSSTGRAKRAERQFGLVATECVREHH